MSLPTSVLRATYVLAITAMLTTRAAPAATVLPLTPYKIQVLVAVASAPGLTPAMQRDLRADLPSRAESIVGAAWQLTVVSAPEDLRQAATTNLENVSVETVLKAASDVDKVMLLAIAPAPDGYRVTARELDVRAQMWNAPVARVARHASRLGDASLRALVAAFGPSGTIETVHGRQVKVRLRASALAPLDPTVATLQPGDGLRPTVRLNDASGNVQRIGRPPWTLLRVERISPEHVDCRLESGVRGVELVGSAGGLESLAVSIARTTRTTRLVMQTPATPPVPLVAYEVYRAKADGTAAELMGQSDRSGAVTIGQGATTMDVLLVTAGHQPLAHLPLAPGADPEVSVALPDAMILVEAQGRLAGIQDRIADEFALRELLIAHAKDRIRAKHLDEAQAALGELKALNGREPLAQALASDKKWTVADDTAVQSKIDALFAETAKLLEERLGPEPIAALEAEWKAAGGK